MAAGGAARGGGSLKNLTTLSDGEVKAWGQNFLYRLGALVVGGATLFLAWSIGMSVGWLRQQNPRIEVNPWILFDKWMYYAVSLGLLVVVVVGIPRRGSWGGLVKGGFWGLTAVAVLLFALRMMHVGER